MSLATWKDEFYPITAHTCARRDKTKALDHSIQKWDGVKPENLERHGVILRVGDLICKKTSARMIFSARNCALCVVHLRVRKGVSSCNQCPLALSRGGVPCDDVANTGEIWAPYHYFNCQGTPIPMQRALAAAKVWLAEQKKTEA